MTTIAATAEIQIIPLNRLIDSPENVRRVPPSPAAQAEMEASIRARGILQNLTVKPAPKGKFAVTAGGRRFRALKALAKAKEISADYGVPCAVREDGIEVSLAENMGRVAMHPADEFDAFNALADQGQSVAGIAARFGVTERTVEQRLKLARVSPRLIEAFRRDEIGLEAMIAFAVTDDHEHQETVWKACGPQPRPHDVRQRLTQGRVDARDRRVRFIGLDAYEAAGGTVTRDLFGREADCWINDVPLLDRLTMAKIEEAAAPFQAEGWKWSSVTLTEPDEFYKLRQIAGQAVPLSDEDSARLSVLAARYDELAEIIDASEDNGEAEGEIAKVESEMETMQEREHMYTEEQRGVAGVVVFLAQDGTLRVQRGVVRAEDETEARTACRSSAAVEGNEGESGSRQVKGGLSAALTEALEQQRSAGFQVALMNAPQVAFRVAVLSMARMAVGAGYLRNVTSISAHEPNLAAAKEGPALATMQEAEDRWAKRLPDEDDKLWQWIEGQDDTTLMDLLAFCVAKVSAGGSGVWGGEGLPIEAKVAQAAGLDMRPYWTPTAEGYFSRVSKPLILEAVTEVAGDDAARRIAPLKKADMARAAEEVIAGKGWLPAILRTPGVTA